MDFDGVVMLNKRTKYTNKESSLNTPILLFFFKEILTLILPRVCSLFLHKSINSLALAFSAIARNTELSLATNEINLLNYILCTSIFST